jgi:poly(hydroxyalkanoate) granule-associated protein
MATKSRPTADAAAHAPASESAHHNWLAGLGALASAQAEGGRAFEALVKQGLDMQNRTQALAKERMAAMTSQAVGAVAPWNRLGGIFEERVAQALTGLGMPTAQELAALTARVEALERALAPSPPKAVRAAASRKKP